MTYYEVLTNVVNEINKRKRISGKKEAVLKSGFVDKKDFIEFRMDLRIDGCGFHYKDKIATTTPGSSIDDFKSRVLEDRSFDMLVNFMGYQNSF